MKQKRAKAYRKQMAYYHLNFKFREPYQVLIDEEIILEAIKTKYDLLKGLERTLQGKIKPMISQCTVSHLYRTKNPEAIALAKSFERRRCGHYTKQDNENLKSSYECMVECVDVNGNNKHRYVVASQKPKLRARLRRLAAVPLVYMNRSVMIMEPMSPITEKIQNEIENAKLVQGLNDTKTSKRETEENQQQSSASRKRKGPKEPNPLSVKRKKIKAVDEKKNEQDGETNESEAIDVSSISQETRKRKRKRRHNKEKNQEVDDQKKEKYSGTNDKDDDSERYE